MKQAALKQIVLKRNILILFLFVYCAAGVFAQTQSRIDGFNDGEAAEKYAAWVQQALDEGRISEAHAALRRASDFSNVSSDISYLLALVSSKQGADRISVIETLDSAIETNRWTNYDAGAALLLKAEQLAAMRRFAAALEVLEKIDQVDSAVGFTAVNESAIMQLRLRSLRGMADAGDVQAEAQFRKYALIAMDRFPRESFPLRIFFEYARKRNPAPLNAPYELPESDLNLLELALRRLPFLLETDPELAWQAAPFIREADEARRLVSAYRAGGLSGINAEDFMPCAASIPIALNLGLLDDKTAVEELFSGAGGMRTENSNTPAPNLPLQSSGKPLINRNFPFLEKAIITETFNLLRSAEGRDFLTQKLLALTGAIFSDEDNDGFIDIIVNYEAGAAREFIFDREQANVFDFRVTFSADGYPVTADIPFAGRAQTAQVQWERYPSVKQVTLENETFFFRPADFQFALVDFIVLGGSGNFAGAVFPVLKETSLSYRSLVSFALSVSRPSAEFPGGVEQIMLDKGIIRHVVETVNGNQVSLAEFEKGFPVVQYVDLDLDGKMETTRRFRRPPESPSANGSQSDFDISQTLDWRGLIASSESDPAGKGLFKTEEVYQKDGSVVYSWDMDGTGSMNHSETEERQE